jgi:hypothetical protein
METKKQKIEEFKLALIKNIEGAINNDSLSVEDIIGTLENVKMITFKLCSVDMPMASDPPIIGYR